MPQFGLASALVVVLLIGVGIGYLSSLAITGNSVLKDPNSAQSALEDPRDTENSSTETILNTCNDAPCADTVKICTDGVNSSCSNTCSGKACTNCKPDCSGHENNPLPQDSTSQNNSIILPVQTQAPQQDKPICNPNWSCTDWPNCSSGSQIRVCNDLNICGTNQGKPTETQTCSQTPEKVLSISLSTNNQTITRGNDVVIKGVVSDGQSPIGGASISLVLTYASGSQFKNSSTTNPSGDFSWTKTIGGSSKPGTFKVEAKASKTSYVDGSSSTTFEVVNKTG